MDKLYEEFKKKFFNSNELKPRELSKGVLNLLLDYEWHNYRYHDYHESVYLKDWGFGRHFKSLIDLAVNLEKEGDRNLNLLEIALMRDSSNIIIFESHWLNEETIKKYGPIFLKISDYSRDLTDQEFDLFLEIGRKEPREWNKDFLILYKKYLKHIKDNPNANADAIYMLENFYHPDYKLLKVLGSGANKTVFLARDKDIQEDEFAVKIFDIGDVEAYIKKRNGVEFEVLKHEKKAAKFSRDIKHPNISIVKGIHNLEGKKYIIEEELFDCTLEDLVDGEKKLTLSEKYTILFQTFSGLTAYHSAKLCHGDLTPANVGIKIINKVFKRRIKKPSREDLYKPKMPFDSHEWINEQSLIYQVKLTDAGFATTFKTDGRDFFLGGMSTRAPELFPLNGKLVTPTKESDLWSLGVLMYYLFSDGEYPFYRGTKEEKELNFKEYEKRVYDDIKTKLENSGEFDEHLKSKFQMIQPEDYRGVLRIYDEISYFLKSEPNERLEDKEMIKSMFINGIFNTSEEGIFPILKGIGIIQNRF